MTGRPACAALQTALLLLLLTTASCWGIGRQRPAVSKTAKPAKVEHVSTKATAHTLPPNTFLRVFALPSFEAKLAQHHIGELLASSCKNHARVGGCKLSGVALNSSHVRVLQFEEGEKRSVLAYMLQQDDNEVEKALDECNKREGTANSAQENGKDYRCFKELGQTLPTDQEVLSLLQEPLEKLGVTEELASASHKTIFLTSDPKQIIYHEATKLVGSNGDPDFFLQTLRNSFRRIVEWVAFQFQRVSDLTTDSPVLFSYAEDLDANERGEVQRILEFLQIEDLHVVEETVTANSGEVRFQKERLRTAIAALPPPLIADIDEFLEETVQDRRMLGRYTNVPANRSALWPPPAQLQQLSVDNTILVTAATCAYAPLVINWIKHIYDLGIPCYLVVALDDALYDFLHRWVPEHVVRAPPGFTPAVPHQYAAPGSAAMRHLSRARLATLEAITDQGYHAAWTDADIALTQNIFLIFSRWFDLVAGWSGGNVTAEPLAQIDKVVGYELKFDKQRAGRKVSPSFLFVRGSPAAQQFLQKWREAANRSHTLEDGAVLDELLRLPEVNSALSIQIVSEARFPTGDILFSNGSEVYSKAWEKGPPAWAHADSAHEKDEKIKLLASGKYWKLQPGDPEPRCPRPTEDFLADGSVVPMWPAPAELEKVAEDDTVLLTAATCGYGDLLTNWIKHVWDLQIRCFYVAAADNATAEFLGSWLPGHAAQVPQRFDPKATKFVQRDSTDFSRIATMKPRLIGTMLSQGFRAAWSDADVVWLRNPFTMFDKSADLVLAWADNSHVTGGVILPPGTFPGEHKGRKVGSAFVFAKPGHATQQLMDAWAEKVAGGSSDESAALNELLLQPRFHGNLTIGMFPSAAFPTGAESTDDQNSHHQQLQDAWKEESNKPAWLHADSALSHDAKAKLLKSAGNWRVDSNDAQPKCGPGGRKLGDLGDQPAPFEGLTESP